MQQKDKETTMADLNTVLDDQTGKVSRRNVMIGTAWAVPTIMTVGAAPAVAASGQTGSLVVTRNGKDFTFKFTVSPIPPEATMEITSITYSPDDTATFWANSPVGVTGTTSGGEVNIIGKAANPANKKNPIVLTVSYTLDGVAQTPVQYTYE
ncbi:hypothetical protein [Aestuariimicrobium ganziense]|uniref:hypothetical protein n=1 Tax=Aestuariimicrobium ganziense TaxID=2773677 RepID=UPI001944985D|nr:hypothetical protein [Aestuariimicrobium ganziense]